MTTIFVSHAQADAACAETIREGLEAHGYTVFREPGYPGPGEASYAHMIEHAMLGSAALVLVWSSAGARDAWVERCLIFARRLNKLILPVVLNGAELPNTLIVETVIACQPPCDDAVAQLLPHLATLDGIAPLLTLCAQAASERILFRKQAIEQAAGMLQRGEYREEVLALLEYLAKNDLMMGVREKAQEALEADARRTQPAAPPPLLRPADARHIFGVKCKNGHVTYFDKRRVCSAKTKIARDRAGKKLDELYLTCGTCGEAMAALIDCEGYSGVCGAMEQKSGLGENSKRGRNIHLLPLLLLLLGTDSKMALTGQYLSI